MTIKIKGHVIAKIIFFVVFSFAFSYISLYLKDNIDNNKTDWKIIKSEVMKKDTIDLSDKIDKYIRIKSIEWFILLNKSSKIEIIFYNMLFSLLLTIVTDLFGGVGRRSLLFH